MWLRDGDDEVDSINLREQGQHLIARTTTSAEPHGPNFPFSMITMVVPVPFSTLTVDSTIVRTTFVTITTRPSDSSAGSCAGSQTSLCNALLPPTTKDSETRSLPSIISPTSSTPLATSTVSLNGPSSSSHSGSHAGLGRTSSLSTQQRHAIVGGLAGSIAGLVLIGIILATILRRRHARREVDGAQSEKAQSLKDSVTRSWSQLTRQAAKPISRPPPPPSRSGSTADVASIIEVGGTWPRPFAHHQSFRESVGIGQLRVVNPDNQSISTTPAHRGSLESSTSYFKRQRSALAAAVLGENRSRANSNAPSQKRSPQVPTISVDRAASSGNITQNHSPPSFRSYPSITSARTVQQHPPEDPFLTPPDEAMERTLSSSSNRLQRPSLAVLQGAAGSAGRTLSNLGQALNPFRSKSNQVEDDSTSSRQSTLTFSSNGDPFKLDRRSVPNGSFPFSAHLPQTAPSAYMPTWRMYEGT